MEQKTKFKGRVLIVAGSDSGGGAGIQGDLKTVTALGGYAATAITALTAQNTLGVFGIHEVPDDFIAQQMRLVLDDIGADAIKTGMLQKASVIETVADVLEDYPNIPLILDPVMVAKGGAPLLQPEAREALVKRLIPRALLVTPNVPEAELLAGGDNPMIRLSGYPIKTVADMHKIGETLMGLGPQAVLMKGGHLKSEHVTDILIERSAESLKYQITEFSGSRIPSRHTHGTGCTLASAIAVSIAQGMELKPAVTRARAYVQEAIRTAPGLGKGHGPLNHNIVNQ